MIVSIYLHKYVVDTLQLFGSLDETINRILQAGADGDIEILDRPPCINRDGAARYSVDITQRDYLELLECYPTNSPKVSIRRIIYWFVDFAIYEQLSWKTNRKYVNKELEQLCKHIGKARSAIARVAMAKRNDNTVTKKVTIIDGKLLELEEYLKNG